MAILKNLEYNIAIIYIILYYFNYIIKSTQRYKQKLVKFDDFAMLPVTFF